MPRVVWILITVVVTMVDAWLTLTSPRCLPFSGPNLYMHCQVKAFSRSSPGFETSIIVGGTHMSEQVKQRQWHRPMQCLGFRVYPELST